MLNFVVIGGITLTIASSLVYPEQNLESVLGSLGVSLMAGMLTALYDFQRRIAKRYADERSGELSREIYAKQRNNGIAASREQVTIEHIYRDDNGSVRKIEYDTLPTTKENLAILFREYNAEHIKLSKEGVRTALNVGDKKAAEILSAMEEFNYIYYPGSRNAPQGASYTERGETNSRKYLTYLLALEPTLTQTLPPHDGVGEYIEAQDQ